MSRHAIDDIEGHKRAAAVAALELVRPGMRLGLGTGSTSDYFLEHLAKRVRDGLDVTCVPTSEVTRRRANALKIPLTTLDETPRLDLAIDGADEIAPDLTLVKGGGGAFLHEKIVASAAESFVVIADASKCVPTLGRHPLPVEVVPFGVVATGRALEEAARAAGSPGVARLRLGPNGGAFVTDESHWIVDLTLEPIAQPSRLASLLANTPGVVEHGLFVGLACAALVGGPRGVLVLTRTGRQRRRALLLDAIRPRSLPGT